MLTLALSKGRILEDTAGLLAACGTALALVFGLRGASGEGASSPFFGRVLDVFQGLTLIVALPSAVYASGLFDAVRQLAA